MHIPSIPFPCSHRFALAAVALLALCTVVPAQAQGAWPTKPVRFVNSFPPGGPSDTIARSIADVLQAQFRQPFVVENKAGASGNIGTDFVAKSPADGYTVLIGIDTTVTVNPHIYKGMPFKPSDLRPLMVMASSGLLIGVHPSTGFKTLQDLVAAGKTKGVTALAVTSRQRSKLAPEIPTVAEAGLQARLASLDLFYEGLTGAAAGKRLQDLSDRYARVIKTTGMKVE